MKANESLFGPDSRSVRGVRLGPDSLSTPRSPAPRRISNGVRGLVDSGATPRAQLEKAEEAVADAQDAAFAPEDDLWHGSH